MRKRKGGPLDGLPLMVTVMEAKKPYRYKPRPDLRKATLEAKIRTELLPEVEARKDARVASLSKKLRKVRLGPGTGPDRINGKFAKGNQAAVGNGSKGVSLTDLLRKELDRLDPADAAGRTNAEIIVAAIVRKAKAGKSWAAKDVQDRLEGKPKQTTSLTAEGGDGAEIHIRIGAQEL